MMKQFMVLGEHPETRQMTADSLTVSKNVYVGMCQDVWESIRFKYGMMINTIELYSSVLV